MRFLLKQTESKVKDKDLTPFLERVDAQSFGKQTADAKADRRTSFF